MAPAFSWSLLPQDSHGNLAVSWLCSCFLFVPFNKNDAEDEEAEMGELFYCVCKDVNRMAPAKNSCSVCWFGFGFSLWKKAKAWSG